MGGAMLIEPRHAGVTFTGVSIDSREVKPGRLFFALAGERVDGFDFCEVAAKAGRAYSRGGRGRPARRGRERDARACR